MSEFAYDPIRCRTTDILTFSEGNDEKYRDRIIARSDEYLSAFVAPTMINGKRHCFNCGKEINPFSQAVGLPAVAFSWGLTHGEGFCTGCGWPARGIHRPKLNPKDKSETEPMWTLSNFFLSYHPDYVTKAKEES